MKKEPQINEFPQEISRYFQQWEKHNDVKTYEKEILMEKISRHKNLQDLLSCYSASEIMAAMAYQFPENYCWREIFLFLSFYCYQLDF